VGITQTDTKKRLSEDLGVALSSLFMAEAFGVTWDTIAQIPQNSKLSILKRQTQNWQSSPSYPPTIGFFQAKPLLWTRRRFLTTFLPLSVLPNFCMGKKYCSSLVFLKPVRHT
jgi:hypothetical protein